MPTPAGGKLASLGRMLHAPHKKEGMTFPRVSGSGSGTRGSGAETTACQADQ